MLPLTKAILVSLLWLFRLSVNLVLRVPCDFFSERDETVVVGEEWYCGNKGMRFGLAWLRGWNETCPMQFHRVLNFECELCPKTQSFRETPEVSVFRVTVFFLHSVQYRWSVTNSCFHREHTSCNSHIMSVFGLFACLCLDRWCTSI